jgi:hypothetical protein
MIWTDTRPWCTKHIAWMYERSARVHETRAGKYRVCVSYNEMMSIYPRVFQIYSPCRWVHLRYPCISVCVYIETWIIHHAITWCSESCDCNNDDYDKRNALWLWNPAVRLWHPVACRACTEVSAALELSCRDVQRSQQPQNLNILIAKSCSILRMLLQRLGPHCKAPGGTASIRKYVEALVRATGVAGRFACGFRTDLHFAHVFQWQNFLLQMNIGLCTLILWCHPAICVPFSRQSILLNWKQCA